MAISDLTKRTIKCDSPECKNEVVFDPQKIEEIQNLPDWVRTFRTVQNGKRDTFGYCSDVCEVQGVTTGKHNVPEPKAIQPAAGAADIQAAARDAAAASEANTALKEGTIQLTDAN
jgi:hypothetical protein